VVAKVRERVAIGKQVAQKLEVERFTLKHLSELEVREQYQIKISNMFAALENLVLVRPYVLLGKTLKRYQNLS
jgi:hypothetical protein